MNEKGTMISRRRKDLLRAHVLVLDDIGTKTEAPTVEPSYKLESSEGNFQWGYLLEPTDQLAEYEALLVAVHGLGWGDAGAGGSYRVVRVPGSANMKEGRAGFRSRIVEWSVDRIWSLEDLAEAFGLDLYDLPLPKQKETAVRASVEVLEDIDIMLNFLSDNGHVLADDGGQWVDIMCPWADEHTTGTGGTGYSPLGRGGDDWEATRGFSCRHEHCKDRGIKDLVSEMQKSGGPFVAGYDPLPWIQARYVYVGMGQQVADMVQRKRGGRWIWDLADWGKNHAERVQIAGHDKPVALYNAFVWSKRTRRVDHDTYVPVRRDADVGVVEEHGQQILNAYVPPRWEEVHSEPTIFLEHIEYLIPDGGEQDIFLDWLAFKIQNPDRRSYAVVMVADEVYGTGRSWLKNMIELALQGGVGTCTLPCLIGRGTPAEQTYNDWQSRIQILCVEEAKDASVDRDIFFHSYETFKVNVDPMIRVDQRINPKYGKTRWENIYYNALIFTNHRDALAFPENDRRICVLANAGAMNTPEYYDRLAGGLNRVEGAKVYWWLMHRNLGDYDPVYPPMTPSKAAMIEVNRSPAEQIMDYILDNSVSDLVTKNTLRLLVTRGAGQLDLDTVSTKPGAVLNHIWAKLGSLRDIRNGFRISTEKGQEAVRAVRNKEKWRSVGGLADGVAAREEYDRGQKGELHLGT
ncbi:MAG: primase-helicase family protein, partial [bacterium]